MSKAKNVIGIYSVACVLIDRIRTGWKDWGVARERVESVAEHTFKEAILAIGIDSEFDYDIDIFKVVYMIVIHDIAEALIGDLTPFQISREEKKKLEHEAIRKIFKGLLKGEEIMALFLEFDAHETSEAKFAYMCDKLECDLQCKRYDMEHCVDLNNQENNKTFYNQRVQELLKDGNSWSDMWIKFDMERVPYDENFKEILQYAMEKGVSSDLVEAP